MSVNMTIDDFRLLLEDVLDQSGLTLAPETTAKDIEGWDSLNHVRLLLRIEQRYGIDLPIGDIEDAKNVGELLAIINHLLAS
jgi:acyl carrier protein